MSKKKIEKSEPVCGTCAQPFDRRKAAKAAREGRAFVHDCGRVLVRGNLSALPTHSHAVAYDDIRTHYYGDGHDHGPPGDEG